MGERIIPVFRARGADGKPGRIAKYLSGYADDTNRGMVRFNHGIRMFVAWANSPGSMASYFGRINIADETDKTPNEPARAATPSPSFSSAPEMIVHARSMFLPAPRQAVLFMPERPRVVMAG
jgi:hypothetical protein